MEKSFICSKSRNKRKTMPKSLTCPKCGGKYKLDMFSKSSKAKTTQSEEVQANVNIGFRVVFSIFFIFIGIVSILKPSEPFMRNIGFISLLVGLYIFIRFIFEYFVKTDSKKKNKKETKTKKKLLPEPNIIDAIKRPFMDSKSLFISFILCLLSMIIPLGIPLLPLQGYLIRASKETHAQNKSDLPKWDNWGDLFVKGIQSSIIYGIYLIPLSFFIIWHISSILKMGNSGDILNINLLSTMANFQVLFFIILIATYYIVPMALVSFAVKGNFLAGFDISNIFKAIFTKEYFGMWFSLALYSVFVYFILGVLVMLIKPLLLASIVTTNVVGLIIFISIMFGLSFFVMYLVTMAQMTLFAVVYRNRIK